MGTTQLYGDYLIIRTSTTQPSKNHPIEKEHLPNLHLWVQHVNYPGCIAYGMIYIIYIYIYLRDLHLLNCPLSHAWRRVQEQSVQQPVVLWFKMLGDEVTLAETNILSSSLRLR